MAKGETIVTYYYTMIRVDQGVPEHKVEQIGTTVVQSTDSKEVATSTIGNGKIPSTNNKTNTKTSETKNIKSGDVIPVVAITIILVLTAINILLQLNIKSGKRVKRNSKKKGRRVK